MRVLLTSMALAVSVGAVAQVYKSTTPDGRTVYSDRPTAGAEEITVKKLQTYTPAPLPPATEKPEEPESEPDRIN